MYGNVDGDLDPYLLYAISLVSSSKYLGKGFSAPSPYVVASPMGTKHHLTRDDAEKDLRAILPKKQNVCIGHMQVCISIHKHLDPYRLLDPVYNLEVAAEILQKTMSRTDDPVLGVGRYFHGTNTQLALNKGRHVWAVRNNLERLNDVLGEDFSTKEEPVAFTGVFNRTLSQVDLSGTVFERIGKKTDIPPLLLYSYGIMESAVNRSNRKGVIAPYPFVFRSKDGARFFNSLEEAESPLLEALEKFDDDVDVGMMQVNAAYHRKYDPIKLLDPEYNVTAAAQIIRSALDSTDDLVIGIGRYHSWTPSRAEWYGNNVLNIYKNLSITRMEAI